METLIRFGNERQDGRRVEKSKSETRRDRAKFEEVQSIRGIREEAKTGKHCDRPS